MKFNGLFLAIACATAAGGSQAANPINDSLAWSADLRGGYFSAERDDRDGSTDVTDEFRARIRPADILGRARTWIARPNDHFSNFISADLRSYMTESTINDIAAAMANDLEAPAASLNPDLGAMLAELRAQGLHAILSDSGPTIAILTDRASLRALADELKSRYPHITVLTAYGPAAGAHVGKVD